jgi:hypothetical protein
MDINVDMAMDTDVWTRTLGHGHEHEENHLIASKLKF